MHRSPIVVSVVLQQEIDERGFPVYVGAWRYALHFVIP